MTRRLACVLPLVVLGGIVVAAPSPAGAAQDPILDLPVQTGAPWPQMRRDRRGTARSPIVGRAVPGARPWTVTLEKGIFNTPVVDRAGTAYVGSAAGVLWAIDRRGKVLFRYRTGGLLDAGGVLTQATDPRDRDGAGSLVFGSGDETLYRIRLTRKRLSRAARTTWTFKPQTRPATGQLVNYWEGPLALSPTGDVLAGNTGGGAFRIGIDGRVKSVHQAANSVWTAPATGDDGTTFWGSVDRSFFALKPDGSLKWSLPSLGFVTASPAIGTDGTVYTASFDGKVYALDPRTGLPRWTFQTRDHVYGGPALAQDAEGRTSLVVVGSTDGGLYGLTPDGRQVWRYETGDPIRSSPAIGVAPDGGQIAYVGSSNGRLYAIDVQTGRRRWSYDTTPADPVLRDRNDLNGSPALTFDGVLIGGEHGIVTRVPYDWCRTARGRRDARCSTDPADELPASLSQVAFVTPGGTTLLRGDGPAAPVPGATTIATRLLVRQGGQTVDAGAQPALTRVTVDPPFPHRVELSGDGQFVVVQPDGFLEPDTQYTVRSTGTWLADGLPLANTTIGGTRGGRFDGAVRFRTRRVGRGPTLAVGADRVSALEITRLAVPLPPLLPSVNQIGFDQYDLIAGLVRLGDVDPATGERDALLWVVGGRRDARGRLVADPKAGFSFPLAGRLRGDEFLLRRDGLTLQFSFGSVPLRRFELRGALTRRAESRPGTALYAEVTCNDVPNYGPLLVLTGICNASGTLVVGGTFLIHRYDPRGGAATRPAGVSAGGVVLDRPTLLRGGSVRAVVRSSSAPFRAAEHLVSVLLTDARTGAPVGIDYQALTRVETDASGTITGVRVALPAGTRLPAAVRATVMADAFPLQVVDLR